MKILYPHMLIQYAFAFTITLMSNVGKMQLYRLPSPRVSSSSQNILIIKITSITHQRPSVICIRLLKL